MKQAKIVNMKKVIIISILIIFLITFSLIMFGFKGKNIVYISIFAIVCSLFLILPYLLYYLAYKKRENRST